MKYVFGKAISRKFYPEENGAPLKLPTQTPTIYVYSSEPKREDALTGTGAIASAVTSWTQESGSPYGCSYTLAAIADPDDNGTTEGAWYYESIKFKTESAGEDQLVIRAFFLEIARGNESIPGTTVDDIKNNYPAISSYLDDSEIEEFLASAITELRGDLEAKGAEWHLVSDLYKTKLAVAYKTIALCSFSQVFEPGDKFDRRFQVFEERYLAELKKYALPYDADKDGKAESTVSAQTSYVIIGR